MKYIILLLLATSLTVAQGINQKPPFQWEQTNIEGVLSTSMFRCIKNFSDNSLFVITSQNKNPNYRFFQRFNIVDGSEIWSLPDSVDGMFLNTSLAAKLANTFTNEDDKIHMGYIFPATEYEKPNYRYNRTVSFSIDGIAGFETDYVPGSEVHRLLQIFQPLSKNEFVYTNYESEPEVPGYERMLIGYQKGLIKKSFPILPFHHYLHSSQWYIPNIWKKDENTLEYFIGLMMINDTNNIAYRTINLTSGEEQEVRISTTQLGFPNKTISLEFIQKIKNYFFVYAKLYSDEGVEDDRVLMKIDNNGTLINHRIIPYNFVCWGFETGPENSLFVHGYSYNQEEEPNTGFNQWLARYDFDLNKTHEYVWGTNNPDILSVVHYVDNIGLVIGGFYNRSGSGATFVSQANIGLIPESVFLGVSSVAENKSETLSLKIVEDASANSSIVLHSQMPQSVSLKLLDANGRLVSVISNGMVSEGEHRFALPTSLSNGMYLVSCEQNGTILSSEKFIIKK